MADFTHFNDQGRAKMIDVWGGGKKPISQRVAVAAGRVLVNEHTFALIQSGGMKKGDVLGVARIAGIMGAKKTSELIPLCHILNLTSVTVDFIMQEESSSITAVCETKTTGKTGVEMEALTGVQISLLTIYDMCKSVDKTMEIYEVCLCSKSGGKSGDVVYRTADG